jgi:hypothetical protein
MFRIWLDDAFNDGSHPQQLAVLQTTDNFIVHVEGKDTPTSRYRGEIY